MKKILIYVDILGFKKLAEEIATKASLHEDWVRETMLSDPLKKTIGQLTETLQLSAGISQLEGSDNYILAVDRLETALQIVRKLITIRLPLNYRSHIPLEVVVGVKEIEDIDVELKNRKEVIEFLKDDIATQYRTYQKSKGKVLKQTYIILTVDGYRELGASEARNCTRITVGQKTFYTMSPSILQDSSSAGMGMGTPLVRLLIKSKISEFNKRRKRVAPDLIDLTRTNLEGLNLAKADLSGLSLKSTNLRGADLSDANLEDSDLADANLDGAKLNRTRLNNTSFKGASLIEADLSDCNINGSNFSRANLTGAKMRQTGLFYSNFLQANLNEVDLASSTAKESDFARATFLDSDLQNVFFNRVDLSEADLRRARMNKAQIGFSFLNESDLRKAVLSGVHFSETDLSKADLRGIVIDNETLIAYRPYRGLMLEKKARQNLARNWAALRDKHGIENH